MSNLEIFMEISKVHCQNYFVAQSVKSLTSRIYMELDLYQKSNIGYVEEFK